jgi:hypothetical protein
MPPRGVKSAKRERQYEHIKESEKKQGRSTKRAKEIAAATVNKQRRQAGETKNSRKKSSTKKSSTKKSSSKKSASTKKSASSRSRKKR